MTCEALIDLMKEWVIAQAYATIAWVQANYYTQAEVEEWAVPMHISGTLDPVANCTYHKAGTYNGKPYYIREDANWYVWWWTAMSEWIISPLPGMHMGPQWIRSDPDIEGNYVAGGGATGIATVTAGYGCPKRCLVNRGDPLVPDFVIGNFTIDSAWHDLDLSSIIPEYAKGVAFSLFCRNTLVNHACRFRMNGNAGIYNAAWVTSQVANVIRRGDLTVLLPESRIIEYWMQAGGWDYIALTVKGWWY